MSQASPIGGWLVAKKLQFAEENVYGVPAPSPSYSQIGYNPQVQFSAPTSLTPLLQPNSEDPQVLIERRIDEYTLNIVYRPFDMVFVGYGFNPQGGGSGTIDKSLTLSMSILLGGVSESFFQFQGARINSLRIGGRAGGPITVQAQILNRTTLISGILPGSFSANPASIPLQFWQGGDDPVSIGGVFYSVNSIEIRTDRNLDKIMMPGSELAQVIIPRERRITGTISLVYRDTDNYGRLQADTPFTLVWTIRQSDGTMITLTGCRFKALTSLSLQPSRTVYETYSFEALAGTVTIPPPIPLPVVQPLVVNFTFSPSNPVAGQQITFTAIVTGGVLPYTYHWDWGDGSTSDTLSPTITHIYSSPGNYTVSLSVTDSA